MKSEKAKGEEWNTKNEEWNIEIMDLWVIGFGPPPVYSVVQ
jgi:hypothetical protein